LLDSDARINRNVKKKKKYTYRHTSTKSINPTGNKKAIIIAPYQSDFNDDLCSIKTMLQNKGFHVDAYVDTSMSDCNIIKTNLNSDIFEAFKILNEYDFIYINSHGNNDLIATGIPNNSTNTLLINSNKGVGITGSDV